MGRKNLQGLPAYLHQDVKGQFYRKYPIQGADGIRRWKRELVGPMSRKEAIQIHHIWRAKLAKGEVNPEERPQVRFKQACDAFLDYSRSRKRSWQADIEQVGKMLDFFGDIPLASFNPSLAQKFLTYWQNRERKVNRPLKEATLNNYIACLHTIMNQAVNNGFIGHNPVKGLKKYTVNNQRTRTLKPEEYDALISKCSEHLKPMIQIAYKLGMRKGEILGLRWDQVVIEDNGSGSIKLGANDTKTKEGREVPLDEGLISLIKGLRRPGAIHVFTFKGRPVNEVKTAFNKACLKAGIKDFRFCVFHGIVTAHSTRS